MMQNNIKLSEHFTFSKIFKFTLPSVTMMVFLSIYSIVDGFFVSNFVGKIPFASLNLVFPLIMLMGAIGLMIGTGGSAFVAKTIGQGNREKANKIFSMLIYAVIILGSLLGAACILCLRSIVLKLGATPDMLDFCIQYATIILSALPFFMLQSVFQSFFVAAEKPKIGLYVIVMAGITNIILDYVFIVPFNLGLKGAALATALSQLIGGLIPIFYFARKNNSLLKLGATKFYRKEFIKVIINGSSEFMSNISASIVSAIFNYQLLKYVGEDGVAAYGTIAYFLFIFYAVYMGYCIGISPVISYNYGAKNTDELKSITKKSLKIVAVLGLLMTFSAEFLATPLSKIFVGYDSNLLAFTVSGFKIFAISFIFGGFNVFCSAFFTALNNGVISAAISFLRTLVFESTAVLTLPLVFGVNGIWSSVIVAEIMALGFSTLCFVALRKRYKY
mgnify:CR=1 FL=1